MAEIVSLHQERTIPEYESFKKYGIMDETTLRKCKTTIENFEYKLKSGNKSINVFAEYIIYEKSILTLVLKAEDRLAVDLRNLKKAILKRIVHLYEDGTRSFPSHFSFWESYIKFCKSDLPEKVTGLYQKCLLHHGNRPFLWCSALSWEYESGRAFNKSKHIFYKATLRHSSSEAIYAIFFGILLAETAVTTTVDLENSTISRKSGNFARLYSVYKFAKKNICNCNFLLSLLKQCEDVENSVLTVALQKVILEDLIATFPFKEELWDALAQRELRGFCMNDLQKAPGINIEDDPEKSVDFKSDIQQKPIEVPNISKIEIDNVDHQEIKPDEFWKKRTLKRRIELCIKTYLTAIRKVKTRQMMDMYLNAMLRLNSDTKNLVTFKRNILVSAYRQGHESRLMSIEQYVALIKMLLENKSTCQALEILSTATELHKAPILYQLWLSIYISENIEPNVYETFRLAAKNLQSSEIMPLWTMVLKYYISNPNNKNCENTLKELFKEACGKLCSKFELIRSMYLEWCSNTVGIEETRREYDILSRQPPPSLRIHQKMAEIESYQMNQNIERWRLCHDNAVHFFGKLNVGVWIDYINFEKRHGEPNRLSNLHQNARHSLSADLVDNFIEAFNFSLIEM